jgi:hypothetical protein
MIEQLIPILIVAAVGLCVLGGLAFLSGQSGLDHIKSRTVGDGSGAGPLGVLQPEDGGFQKPFLLSRQKKRFFGFQRKGAGKSPLEITIYRPALR